MSEESEKTTFFNPRAELYADVNDPDAPQWLKHVAQLISNGEGGKERATITFPADRTCVMPGLDIREYKMAGVFENGDILYNEQDFHKFRETKFWSDNEELEDDADILNGIRRIPGLVKIVCCSQSEGGGVRQGVRIKKELGSNQSEELEVIPDFASLMKNEQERKTFNHPRTQFFEDVTLKSTPQWLQTVGSYLEGGDERATLVFPANRICEFPHLDLIDYRVAGIFENGEVIRFEDELDSYREEIKRSSWGVGKFGETETDKEILLGKKLIPGLKKIVCVSESYGGERRLLHENEELPTEE